ncbi:MAG: GlxA family transcriptional regulator [Pseudomonadota bacterium]
MPSERSEDITTTRIAVLLVDGFALLSYASVVEPLRAANTLAARGLYDISQIPVMGSQARSSSGSVVRADAQLGETVDFDLVILIAGDEGLNLEQPNLLHWLRTMARRGATMAGVSGGAIILARAGLMTDRAMTVHWEHWEAVRELFPALHILPSLFVMDGNRATCAGGVAPLDMMHAFIERDHGVSLARQVSDWYLHTQVRLPADPQRSGLAERYRLSSKPMVLAVEAMEKNIDQPLTLEEIAATCALGTRQLNRLFAQYLGQGTMAFYRSMRLERAASLLQQTALPITDVALATGFGDSAHFSKAFRAKYARSPREMRDNWRRRQGAVDQT